MVDLSTGQVLQKYNLPADYFGEGLTDWGSNLIQLTWQPHQGFVYDRFRFSVVETFRYDGEGWGLTHDDRELIMSDATPYLRFLDPASFRVIRRLGVVDQTGHDVQSLNELEYIHGEIYANIWHKDPIVRISPRTGRVVGWIDWGGLIDNSEAEDPDAVLNGIAYDSVGNRLFVPGRRWSKLFEIQIASRQ